MFLKSVGYVAANVLLVQVAIKKIYILIVQKSHFKKTLHMLLNFPHYGSSDKQSCYMFSFIFVKKHTPQNFCPDRLSGKSFPKAN